MKHFLKAHSNDLMTKGILLGLILLLSACAPKSQKSKAQFSLTPSMGFKNLNMAGGAVIYGQRVDAEGAWARTFKGDKEPIIEMDVGKWNFSVITYSGNGELKGTTECGIVEGVNIGEDKEVVDIRIGSDQCADVGVKNFGLKMCSEEHFENPEVAGNCVASGGYLSYKVKILEKVGGVLGTTGLTSACYNINDGDKPRLPTGNSTTPNNPIRFQGFVGGNCTGATQTFMFEKSLFRHEHNTLKTFGNESNYFMAFDLSADGIDEAAPEVTINPPSISGTNFASGAHWINSTNQTAITVGGTCTAFIPLTFTAMGTVIQTINCPSNGAYLVNLNFSGVADSTNSFNLIAAQTKENGTSSQALFAFKKDTVPPLLSLALPKMQFKGGENVTLSYSITDTSGSGVASNATIFINSTPMATGVFGVGSHTDTIPPMNTNAASMTLQGEDIAGNTATPSVLSGITIDSTAPVITGLLGPSNIIGPLREFENGDTLSFQFTLTDQSTGGANTGIGYQKYYYSTDSGDNWFAFSGEEVTSDPAIPTISYVSPVPLTLTLPTLPAGATSLDLKAVIRDGVGNEAVYTTLPGNIYFIDNKLPNINNSNSTALFTGNGNQTITFTHDDSGDADPGDVQFTCLVGGDPCSISNIDYFQSFNSANGTLVLSPHYVDIQTQASVTVTIYASEVTDGTKQGRKGPDHTHTISISNPFSFEFSDDDFELVRFHSPDKNVSINLDGEAGTVSYKVIGMNLLSKDKAALGDLDTGSAISFPLTLESHEFEADNVAGKSLTIEALDSNGNMATATLNFSVTNPAPFIFDVEVDDGETITLPTLNGFTHHFEVDWGETPTVKGIVTAYNDPDIIHTYTSAGTYQIKITGVSEALRFGPSANCTTPIKNVFQLGDLKYKNMMAMFNNCTTLETFNAYPTNTTGVTSFRHFLQSTTGITSIDLTGVSMQSASDISYLFSGSAITFGSLVLPILNTSSATNMSNMFQNTSNLNSINISTFDFSSATNIDLLFHNSAVATVIGIESMNTSNVTSMYGVFKEAQFFNGDLSSWDTSKVTNMSYMFYGTDNFQATGLESLNDWDVSKVTNMEAMFQDAALFNSPLDEWDTPLVTNMKYMFKGASTFNQDINGWDVSSVTIYDDFALGANASFTTIKRPEF